MKTYRVKVNEFQHGELKGTHYICCDVRGKDLDEQTILKRLTNNIKTWQSACNKGYFRQDWFTFKVVSYEEVK